MPTYYATGLTATLATCDLQASLPANLKLTQGDQQRADSRRVQAVFSGAKKMPERPIGEDGSDRGVMQFIGVDSDMPFYMVEAGESVANKREDINDTEMRDAPDETRAAEPAELPTFSSDDSPLTSLSATPAPTRETFEESSLKSNTAKKLVAETKASLADHHPLDNRLQVSRNPINTGNAQALVLDVEFSQKSFPPTETKRAANQGSITDLKVEVYLNGQLADVSFVNGLEGRRSAVQIVGNKVRFAGTRIHRQVEKPWIYSPEAADLNELPDVPNDAERRWNGVSASYLSEAGTRGRDRLGELPPSVEFLTALARVELPERIRGREGIGLIDVVITAGYGRKYGPDTLYLMEPTRLRDPGYLLTTTSATHTQLKDDGPFSNVNSTEVEESSPDIPLNLHRNNAVLSAVSPPPKKTIDLTKELNLDIDLKTTPIGRYENAHGTMSKSGRTLRQRLGDVKKMNAAKMEKELSRIRDEFSTVEPATKKPKLDNMASVSFDDFIATSRKETEMTIDPAKLLKAPPKLPDGADPEVVLTQGRIDMALNEGAASNGHLLRRIASTSPQRTPKKITKASALAGSPTHVPVKSPRSKGLATLTPQRGTATGNGTPLSNRPGSKTDPSPSVSKGGSIRSARKGDAKERTMKEALEAFQMPESCQGSCVTYDEDENIARQIGKARGGDFKEESLIVGMRFVVD